MNVGIGLPSTIPGVNRESLLTWARKSEERGFSTLGTIDRLVYGNYESLIALAAAAAVTDRIRLTTDILLGPLRGNGAVLAKQAATIDSLSNGRFTLGIAVGLREDDYAATGTPFDARGRSGARDRWERFGGDAPSGQVRGWVDHGRWHAGPVQGDGGENQGGVVG